MPDTDSNRMFCRILLAETRRDAARSGVKVGKLTTWRQDRRTPTYFEVWESESNNNPVWTGQAHNADEAKTNYLNRLIESKQDEEHSS